jgi:hypothetical protein
MRPCLRIWLSLLLLVLLTNVALAAATSTVALSVEGMT